MGNLGKKLKRSIKRKREKLQNGGERSDGGGGQSDVVIQPVGDHIEIPGVSVTHQQVGADGLY